MDMKWWNFICKRKCSSSLWPRFSRDIVCLCRHQLFRHFASMSDWIPLAVTILQFSNKRDYSPITTKVISQVRKKVGKGVIEKIIFRWLPKTRTDSADVTWHDSSFKTWVAVTRNLVAGHWLSTAMYAFTPPVLIIHVMIMAEREVFMLERNGHTPSDRIIRHWVRPRGRCCSGTRRFSQRRKIRQHWKWVPLCAHRGRNLGPYEYVSLPTLCQCGKKDLLNLRRWQGRSFSVSEFQCWYNATTLSCYMTPCQPDCTDWWSVPNCILS